MNYTANADGATFFCQEILPHIRQRRDDIQTWIVGRNPLPEVKALQTDHIHVTGFVDDVVPYYERSTVSVVPLRAGSGIRLKILESMALGRPVVSTTLGCEGIDAVDREHILIADTPEQFSEKTLELLENRALYQRIVSNARRLVVNHYDWDAIADRLMDVYADMMA